MSQSARSNYFRQMQAAGYEFTEHYRKYSANRLEELAKEAGIELVTFVREEPKPEGKRVDPLAQPQPQPQPQSHTRQHAYTQKPEDAGLRVDEDGLIWYQDEVLKPSTSRPRARRKLSYLDPGVKTQTTGDGRFVETFEVAGDTQRMLEVKITLPSYQVGIYKDPRFPFKIHIYNGNRGFDLFDVDAFYGGGDMVPKEILRVYVGNDLCYDMRTTIREIQAEARRLQMKGMI